MPKPAPKTAKKTVATSPRSGATVPTGAHPGNTGGKKGRSGRRPNKFKDFCNALANSDDFLAGLKRDVLAGDKDARKLVVEYAVGKPTQPIAGDPDEAPVRIEIVRRVIDPAASGRR